jgi:hypothetical protein
MEKARVSTDLKATEAAGHWNHLRSRFNAAGTVSDLHHGDPPWKRCAARGLIGLALVCIIHTRLPGQQVTPSMSALLSTGPYAGAITAATGIIQQSGIGVASDTTQFPPNGMMVQATLDGTTLPWTYLSSFDDKYLSFCGCIGISTLNELGIYDKVLTGSAGYLAGIMVHEFYHSFVKVNYPLFANDPECDDCEHQLVYTKAFSKACSMASVASSCPLEPPMTEADRKGLVDAANGERQLCLSVLGGCPQCEAPDKPAVPDCPQDECAYTKCPE